MIVALLRDEAPAWLFLPHVFVDTAGQEEQRSPAPSPPDRALRDRRQLYKSYHHWLTFLTASIVGRQAFQEAVAAVDSDNAYIPLLWFFRAGLKVRAPSRRRIFVHGSSAISWAERAHDIQTLDFTRLLGRRAPAGLSEEEFGATLDGWYGQGFGFDQWRRQPIERLLEVVALSQLRGLREFLWRLAVDQQRPDALPVLQEAARTTGDDASGPGAQVQAGEERYAAGDGTGAVECSRPRYGSRPPTSTRGTTSPSRCISWSGLTLGTYLDTAIFVDPDDSDARLNRASIRLARGDAAGACADASHVLERDPANDAAAQMLAEASAADAPGRQ